jgi:MoaA/NifB/PqqE/SkfB family radical SAM enzyme
VSDDDQRRPPSGRRWRLPSVGFRKLLDDNPGLKAIELSNHGEIFLNPALLSVLELAHERGVELSASTGVNLNKIRPEVLEGLVKYQFHRVYCSIDGAIARPTLKKIYSGVYRRASSWLAQRAGSGRVHCSL